MPIFLSEPVSHESIELPFHFSGGFGLSAATIGFMLAVQGVYSLFANLVLFPRAVQMFGTLRTFRFVIITWPLLYLTVPYLVLLPVPLQKPAVYASLLIKITFQNIAFPSIQIMLTNSAPSSVVLGTINGVAASTAALARTLGPTVSGAVHAWGLSLGITGIAWWVCAIISTGGAIHSLFMEDDSDSHKDRGSFTKDEEDAITAGFPTTVATEKMNEDFRNLPSFNPDSKTATSANA